MSFEESDAAAWGIKPLRGEAHRYHQKTPLADYPTHEKTRPKIVDDYDRHRGPSFKELLRMVRKGVGRPWSKVYSELVAYIKKTYSQPLWGDAIRRIDWYVDIKPMHVGDGVYVQESGHKFYGNGSDRDFLVHPETGLLMRPKKEWYDLTMVSPSKESRRYYMGDKVRYVNNTCYRQMDGIWYEVELVNLPKSPYGAYEHRYPIDISKDWLYQQNLVDVVLKKRLSDVYSSEHDLKLAHGYRTLQNKLVPSENYHKRWKDFQKNADSGYMYLGYPSIEGRTMYAKSVRQLSKKEIRRLGLNAVSLKVPDIVRRK